MRLPSLSPSRPQLRASDQDARTKQATVAELESARVALRASLAAEQQRALRAEQLHATQIELTAAAQTDAEKKGAFGKEETARCALETGILKRELGTIKEEHERKMAFALEEQQRRFVAEVEASNDAQMRDFEAVVSSLRERLAKKSDQTIRLQSELSAANERVDAIAARAEQANLALEEQRRSNEEYVRDRPGSLPLPLCASLSLSVHRSLALRLQRGRGREYTRALSLSLSVHRSLALRLCALPLCLHSTHASSPRLLRTRRLRKPSTSSCKRVRRASTCATTRSRSSAASSLPRCVRSLLPASLVRSLLSLSLSLSLSRRSQTQR